MKKLNDQIEKFFSTTSMWNVFLIGFLVTGTMGFSMFKFIPENVDVLTTSTCLKIGGAFGLVFGAFWTLIVRGMRLNTKFWDYSKHVDELIQLAGNKKELVSIEKEEFAELVKMGQGGHHTEEIKKLYAVMKMKYSLLQD